MYKFDVGLNARTTLKERLVWMLYLGLVFFLLYGSANHYAFLTAPHSSLVFEWEQNYLLLSILSFHTWVLI